MKKMTRISVSAFIVLGWVLALCVSNTARPATPIGQRIEINVCEFTVPSELAKANATFTVTYVVQVSGDGHPVTVDKAKNEFLADEPFVQCIKSWILPTANGRLSISFTWKHGQGWSELVIVGEGYMHRIKFEPGAFAHYRQR